MKYQNDIDKMNTNRNLFLMSLPIFVELLLQLLVGNVDQMMVSRVSQPSVAAIVNANQIMNLVIIVLSMASTAVTVILSQYLGAQDEKNASRTCMVSIVLIGGVSLAATIICSGAGILSDLLSDDPRICYGKRSHDYISYHECHEYCGKCDFNQRVVRNAAAWGGRSGDLDGYQ